MNLSAFQIDAVQSRPAAMEDAPRSKSKTNHFARIPFEWMREANLLGGSALAVGALLWYRTKLTGDPVTCLSNVLAEEAGLSRKSKASGLAALVKGGLVRAMGGPGKSPRVILLPFPRRVGIEHPPEACTEQVLGELLSSHPPARTHSIKP